MNKKKTSIMSKVKRNHLAFLLIFSLFSVFNSLQAQDAPANDFGISTDPAVIANGEKFFKANCTSCHAVDKKVIGPALQNVWERVPEPQLEWIYAFVNNSTKVISSGDEYAVNLYNEYNKTQMLVSLIPLGVP